MVVSSVIELRSPEVDFCVKNIVICCLYKYEHISRLTMFSVIVMILLVNF